MGTIFLQVQITRSANLILTCKKISDAKLWLEKAIKIIFDSERRFGFRRNRDIRVGDIESRLYVVKHVHVYRGAVDGLISILLAIKYIRYNITESLSKIIH